MENFVHNASLITRAPQGNNVVTDNLRSSGAVCDLKVSIIVSNFGKPAI
jgi:hypothetical protein